MEVSRSKQTLLGTELKEEEFVEDWEAEEEEEDEEDTEDEEEEEDKDDLSLFKKDDDDEKSYRRSLRYGSDDWDDGFGKKVKKGRAQEEAAPSYDSEEEEEDEEEEDEESYEVSSATTVLSEITFVWEDETYKFERLYDNTRHHGSFQKMPSMHEVYDKVGLDRYLLMCNTLNIAPMTKLIASLPTNEIDLTFRNLDTKDMKALCAALEVNNVVTKLLLRYNLLTPTDCTYFGYVLLYNESILFLDLTGCRIGPEGMEVISEFLGKNVALEVLILSKCKLGDEGMKFLSNALIRNDTIKSLDLSYNGLAEDSAESLALVLKADTPLQDLGLRYNNLYEPSAMKPFYAALASNTNIKYLDLSWNGINGEDMAGHIAKFLRKNQTIEELDLSDNRIESKALLEIRKALPKAKTLKSLKLGNNPLSPEDLDSLLNGVKACPNLTFLDLDGLWVNKSFLKILNKIQQEKEIEVNFEGVFSNYEIYGPDYPALILKRAQYEAQKPKRAKLRRDFGHLMYNLGHKPLTPTAFMDIVKKFKAKVNKELYPELLKQFTTPKTQLIDVVAMRKKYLSLFPDSKPPPPKPKKGKKGKNKDEDEDDWFKRFEEEDEEEEEIPEEPVPEEMAKEEEEEDEDDEEEDEDDEEEEGEYDEEGESDDSDDFQANPFFAGSESLREFEKHHQRMSKFLNL